MKTIIQIEREFNCLNYKKIAFINSLFAAFQNAIADGATKTAAIESAARRKGCSATTARKYLRMHPAFAGRYEITKDEKTQV